MIRVSAWVLGHGLGSARRAALEAAATAAVRRTLSPHAAEVARAEVALARLDERGVEAWRVVVEVLGADGRVLSRGDAKASRVHVALDDACLGAWHVLRAA